MKKALSFAAVVPLFVSLGWAGEPAKAQAEVSYDPAKTTPDKIAESVSKTGFKTSVKPKQDGQSPTSPRP